MSATAAAPGLEYRVNWCNRRCRPAAMLAPFGGVGASSAPHRAAFAPDRNPVIAKGHIAAIGTSRPVTELPNFSNPINGKARPAAPTDERSRVRHDWARSEVVDLLNSPLLDLIDQARSVHLAHHESGTV